MLNEMTVPGKWLKKSEGYWEFNAGKGTTLSVFEMPDGKVEWEIERRGKTVSKGKEKNRRMAQTIAIKQLRQIGESVMDGDLKQEKLVTMPPSQLDDYGIIKRLNQRNRMRAMNLLNGKGPLKDAPVAEESSLRKRNHGLDESSVKAFFARQLDPGQERMVNEVVVMAVNEGRYYPRRDAKGAVDYAVKEYIKNKMREMREDANVIKKHAVKEVMRQWGPKKGK